jgi:hypothetical protein
MTMETIKHSMVIPLYTEAEIFPQLITPVSEVRQVPPRPAK